MSYRLVREVEVVLARAGYGPDSGLSVEAHAQGALVVWHIDPLVKPMITSHAEDPQVAEHARIEGIRAALDAALISVIEAAGWNAQPVAEGSLLVTVSR
ncbi:hypothetical protein ACF1BN_37285 [Streptomyces sp. NPDC014861]|uniref:hypothetical protein n=1 Tax=Streptomyces sp. NPDC014861 TaxID=3364923 RepID=UPI0036FC2E9C